MNRALFLDRDGTINTYGEYIHRIEDITFIDNIFQLIKKFKDNGWYVLVVSNQAGVARGYYTEADVKVLHEQMAEIMRKHDAIIDKWYYCPHHYEHGIGDYKVDCDCRKPKIGMLKKAEADFNLSLSNCFLIGDNVTDIQCAINAGVRYYQADGKAYDVDMIYDMANKGA